MGKFALVTLAALAATAAAAAQEQAAEPAGHLSQPPRTSSEAVRVVLGEEDFDHASFKAVDTNGDGRINRAEASVIAGFDFSSADTNNDAALTRPEYQAAMTTITPESDGAREARDRRAAPVSFETADKNKDGRVNRTEASDIPDFDFTSADANDDASLTRHEFRVALAGSQPRG
jgi:Ca2+-binding EF-hand superfamily protein